MLTKAQFKTLQEASEILLEYSKEYGVCKEYAFNCSSCEVFDLACKLDSFVNFWLDEPTK